ncbi:MAG: hypothetical protein ABSH44_14625 [Bryobacteraceae bacterium]|jgi:CheY-like chemotaxis protein
MPTVSETAATKRILIVEDSEGQGFLFKSEFRGVYETVLAIDGETALAHLPPGRAPEFALAIVDLNLPERAGRIPTFDEGIKILSALQELQNKFGKPLIMVMVSAVVGRELRERVGAFTIVCVLEKPFSLTGLRQQVERLLGDDVG